MEESSGWNKIEGDFGKFWLIMEIPPPQYPSFPFIPLITKQARSVFTGWQNERRCRVVSCTECVEPWSLLHEDGQMATACACAVSTWCPFSWRAPALSAGLLHACAVCAWESLCSKSYFRVYFFPLASRPDFITIETKLQRFQPF
jgi:hypothetical protein